MKGKLIFFTVLVLFLFSCDTGGSEPENPIDNGIILGSWRMDYLSIWEVLTFNSDNSFTAVGYSETLNNYSFSGTYIIYSDRIVLNFTNGPTAVFDYSFSGTRIYLSTDSTLSFYDKITY